MEDTTPASRAFSQRRLPWLLGGAVFVLYLVTLNPWLRVGSIPTVAELSHWDGLLPFSRPLLWLTTLPLKMVSAAHFPVATNFMAALFGAISVGILARCVALLPHDRTRAQRVRGHSEEPLLHSKLAWLPPTFASLLLGLQLTFWEQATAQTGEMLDLMLFAVCVLCLLEYRTSLREVWLWRLAFIYGASIPENWAMIAFLPLFLMALTWIRGLSILNAALLLRLLMWGSIGLLFYLLMPAVSLMSSDHGYSPWEIIKGVLAAQRNFLRGLPRGRFLLLAVVNILPLALVGIRWSGTKASSSLERILSEGAVILLQIGWLGMAVFMAFDRGFSQRELIHLDPVYSGIPLLTYYFAAALGAGYFMGYFLIVGGTQPSRNWDRPSSGVLALARLGWLAMCLIAVATPTALLVRNWPRIQVQNGTQLESLAQAMAGSLPQVPCLVLSDDPLLYGVLTAYLDRNREAFPHLLVNSSMAPEAWYRQRLLRIHGSRWQGMEAFASAQQGVAVSFLGMLRQAAVDHRAFYLNPAITFVTEAFEQRPGGAMFALKAYGKKAVDTTPLSEQEAAGIETFWKQHEAEIASIHAITAFGLPGPHELAVVWSRLANANGVELQESGRLEPASRLFATALQFNPDNAAAAVNQRVNAALRNHQPIPSDATKPLAGRIAPIVLSMDGPIDEPQFLLTIGKALQASTEPSIRSSLIRLARAHQLTPDSTPIGAAYAGACIDAGVPDRALAIVRKLKSNSRLKPDESSTLLRLEANALLASDDLPGAETVLMEARRTAPIDPGPLDLLSQLYNRTGRTEQALEMIDLWQGLRPNDVTVLLRRVMILSGQNRLDESLVLLDRVLKQEPENELARIERANCLFRLNRLDDSRKDYEQLVRRHPDRDSFQAALGAIAERKNETSTAITHYQRYLELAPADAAEYAQVKSRLERLKNGPRTP